MTGPTTGDADPTPRSATALLSTGVRLHYYVDGPPDGAPLLLVHGWPQTGWQFRRVLPLFADAGYRVVADPQVAVVDESAHWIAEENPRGLVDAVRRFEARHGSRVT